MVPIGTKQKIMAFYHTQSAPFQEDYESVFFKNFQRRQVGHIEKLRSNFFPRTLQKVNREPTDIQTAALQSSAAAVI